MYVCCPLCGGSSSSYFGLNLKKKFTDFLEKNVDWCSNVTILAPQTKAQHGFIEIECNSVFKNLKTKKTYNLLEDMYLKKKYYEVLPIHTDCWKFATKKTNREYKYEDFDEVINNNLKMKKYVEKNKIKTGNNTLFEYTFNQLSYHQIQIYWDSFDLNLEQLEKHKSNWYLVCSPLGNSDESKKNSRRIFKNIKQIQLINAMQIKPSKVKKPTNVQKIKPTNVQKIKPTNVQKLKKHRPSPSESATLYEIGKKKKGNDGNMYIIVITKTNVKKWKKIDK